mgnify:CR=1 FL=1
MPVFGVAPKPAAGMPGNYSALFGYGLNPYDPRVDPRDGTNDGPALERFFAWEALGVVERAAGTVEQLEDEVVAALEREIAEHIAVDKGDYADLLAEILPKNIEVQIFKAMLESVAAEHGARMTAMDNAQSNCKEMITQLTLVMNKARQAAITRELMDIVGGAEALKG